LLAALDGGVLGESAHGFRHLLARKAVDDTISVPERALLHDRALHALSGVPIPPLLQLANHTRAAGRADQWQHYSEAAADQAIAHGETARHRCAAVSTDQWHGGGPDVGRLGDETQPDRVAGFPPGRDRHAGTSPRGVAARPPARGTIRLSLGVLLVRTIARLGRGRAEVEKAVGELTDRPELAARGINLLAQPIDGLTPLSLHEGWMWRAPRCSTGWRTRTADRIASRTHIGDGTTWAEFDTKPQDTSSVAERVQLARLWRNLADAQSWVGHLARADG
jgi:hypothetical protein